jgi:hypothetical protein
VESTPLPGAMAPYVLEERSGFYTGRELTIPKG